MSLLVTGTICIDTIVAPTGHREGILGGSCTYFAAAASFYGPVRLVAAVGEDFPSEFVKTLDHFRTIDSAGLEIRKGSKTFRWGGKYLANMDSRETLFTDLGVIGEHPPTVPAKFKDSQFLFLANSHPGVQMKMLESVARPKLVVADTMDFWINGARAELDLLLTKVDGLVLNYDEAELYTGKRNTVDAARAILKAGPKFVVVKKGEHGCILCHRDGIVALPAYPAENVVDPTGAGDSFAGGMMGHLASHKGDAHSIGAIREALAHGTVVASFNIESFSLDRLKTLTRGEIDARYREFASMVRV